VSTPANARSQRESWLIDLFFVIGALLVVVGFMYSLASAWPSFDPMALAVLVGTGLLLVVICERLRLILAELQGIAAKLEAGRNDS
jgi:protein-S-isoprenylcysteine O-methyltransferase Ste14